MTTLYVAELFINEDHDVGVFDNPLAAQEWAEAAVTAEREEHPEHVVEAIMYSTVLNDPDAAQGE